MFICSSSLLEECIWAYRSCHLSCMHHLCSKGCCESIGVQPARLHNDFCTRLASDLRTRLACDRRTRLACDQRTHLVSGQRTHLACNLGIGHRLYIHLACSLCTRFRLCTCLACILCTGIRLGCSIGICLRLCIHLACNLRLYTRLAFELVRRHVSSKWGWLAFVQEILVEEKLLLLEVFGLVFFVPEHQR